ncbi:MAG: four helix bundle protein [Planctomycetota bacterium]|jgi:four helix bundle protein
MATYKRFEDLPVWQKAADTAARVFEWSQRNIGRGNGDLANQLQRATLSISNNIAEGFERGSTNELIHFLYIARGSAGEVRSMLCVMERMPAFAHLKSEISDLKSHCESISRQIRAWTDSLQNSEIKGQRHLNDKTRQQYEQSQRKSEFWQQMDQFKRDQEARLKREAAERNRRSSGNDADE